MTLLPSLTPPSPILTNRTNWFGHDTIAVRVPGILRDIQQRNLDYPESIQQALNRLHDTITGDAPLQMLDFPAPDYELWAAYCAERDGESWLNTVWFFAEMYFYRQVIQAVRWWETGRDPFAPNKAEEYSSPALWSQLETALLPVTDPQERLKTLLGYALWGNRVDLSLPQIAAQGSAATAEDLLSDDREPAVARLLSTPGAVHIIADNAGTELTMDCVLMDALLEDPARQIVYHVKMHPTFVSDTTVPDMLALISMLETSPRNPQFQALGQRLRLALEAGRLRLAPDFYWNSPRFAWQLPAHLARWFSSSALVISKGDANYRRLLGDAIWPPETPFADVVNYFPAPLLALRTLKSDPIVGLAPGMAAALDGVDPKWRYNGRRGIIQYAPQAEKQ